MISCLETQTRDRVYERLTRVSHGRNIQTFVGFLPDNKFHHHNDESRCSHAKSKGDQALAVSSNQSVKLVSWSGLNVLLLEVSIGLLTERVFLQLDTVSNKTRQP